MNKWNKIGIPQKGWNCVDVIDLAENNFGGEIQYEKCEMCENEKIRYVHIMRHPNYRDELHVGCVCAENMSNDYINPRKRETTLKNRAMRRRNFIKKEWKFNPIKCTYSKKYKGEYITIKKSSYGNFGIFFANKVFWNFNGKNIKTFEMAEQAAFDIFERYHTTIDERSD